MVKYRHGVFHVGDNDYIRCPFCSEVKKDGRIIRPIVSLIKVTILAKDMDDDWESPSHVADVLECDIAAGSMLYFGSPRVRTAYNGPGIALHLTCEHGHSWVLNICEHDGRAIHFIEDAQESEETQEPGVVEEEDDYDEE